MAFADILKAPGSWPDSLPVWGYGVRGWAASRNGPPFKMSVAFGLWYTESVLYGIAAEARLRDDRVQEGPLQERQSELC